MGGIYSYFYQDRRKKLCDDLIDDIDFSLQITIHTIGLTPKYIGLLEYLQATNPKLSYAYCKSIYLLYQPSTKTPTLRSNISGDIISGIAADVTRYCLTAGVCDPYYVEVDIISEPHESAKTTLLELIKNNAYYGNLWGIDTLSEQKIKEQF